MQHLVASLPMYNLPEMQAANRGFWQALSALLAEEGMSGLPAELAFGRPPVPDAIGTDVMFTQTCGYPLQTIYRGQHELVGVPTYNAPGCGDATHCAFILVRDDSSFHALADLRGSVFALNSRHSNSGMNLPRRLLADIAGGEAFFRDVVETGSHNASIERVQAGGADCASIDNMTYTFMQDYRPAAVAGLRVIAQTPTSPTIPFVTAVSRTPDEVSAIRRALLRMPTEPRAQDALRALRITDISPADPAAYQLLMRYESEAAALGYPVLA
jgi:ABC-type phosphate/phosphonate transport system substrate-binding protein